MLSGRSQPERYFVSFTSKATGASPGKAIGVAAGWARQGIEKTGEAMKVRASVKPRCEKCRIIRRKGNVLIVCTNPKHKQKQG